MYGYLLKKAFFDVWDQLFSALLVNFVFTVVILGLLTLLGGLPLLVVIALEVVVIFLLSGLVSQWARDVIVAGRVEWKQALPYFLATWKLSLAQATAWIVIASGFLVGVPFYEAMNPFFGVGFGVVLFWLSFFLAGMSLWVSGLHAQVGGTLKSLVRKSFLLFMANPLASAMLFVSSIVITILSIVPCIGLFPGILGLQVWQQTAFRFLLAKYEWLEANPDFDLKKGKLPWKEILAEDLDRLGPRTLRGMIFPWKD